MQLNETVVNDSNICNRSFPVINVGLLMFFYMEVSEATCIHCTFDDVLVVLHSYELTKCSSETTVLSVTQIGQG